MHPPLKCRLRPWTTAFFFVLFGFSTASASPDAEQAKPLPQAPPAAKTAHKNYLSWNPLDLVLSGRFSVGYEHIFLLGERYYGLYVQFTSPMNSVIGGIVTNRVTTTALSDEFPFPSSFDFYLCLHGRGRSRTMRYFPRIGLSRLRNTGQSEWGTYLAFGPCGRVSFGKNFQVTFALSTLKLKLQGNREYNWMQLPVFDFMVGLEF